MLVRNQHCPEAALGRRIVLRVTFGACFRFGSADFSSSLFCSLNIFSPLVRFGAILMLKFKRRFAPNT